MRPSLTRCFVGFVVAGAVYLLLTKLLNVDTAHPAGTSQPS